MFRLIIIYEIIFILFWNILYQSSSGIENWFQENFYLPSSVSYLQWL